MKTTKPRKEKKKKVSLPVLEAPINIDDGLDQEFKKKDGSLVALRKFLKGGEFWTLKKKDRVSVILTHDAVKRISDEAGIRQDPKYDVLTQPNYANNYQYLIQCTVTDSEGRSTTELGESNRSNLGSRGRSNPANMAQKRSFDRSVFRHLGINGLLGEDELEEDKESNVKTLSPDEAKAIAPLINELLQVKKKTDIESFNKKMKTEAPKFNEEQLNVLRKLRDTQLGKVTSTF